MPPKKGGKKPWRKLTVRYRAKLCARLQKAVGPHCHTCEDVAALLSQFIKRLHASNEELSPVLQLVEDNGRLRVLLCELAELCQKKFTTPQAVRSANMSLHDLSKVVVHAIPSFHVLQDAGFPIGPSMFHALRSEESATASAAPACVGGRPSKLRDESLIAKVGEVLDANCKESERIVVVGSGSKRRMVVAKHLEKTKYRLWCEVPTLHKNMGWGTFCTIMQVHFPHVRNPRRDTDLCKHCLHFDKYLLPAAKRLSEKIRHHLGDALPTFFSTFDSSPAIVDLRSQQQDVQILSRMRRFILSRNAAAERDPDRQPLSRAQRVTLHGIEAKAAQTADRAPGSVRVASSICTAAKQLRQLSPLRTPSRYCPPPDGFQRKRQVPPEPARDWRGVACSEQVVAHQRSGGHAEIFVLVVTDVLDHDAQAACMMTNTVIAQLRQDPEVHWEAVERLIVVADCGPHFRSYENVAHYCVTLPKALRIPVEVCWLGEQHGKWCNDWITKYIVTKPIHSLDDLITCFKARWLLLLSLEVLAFPFSCSLLCVRGPA